MAHVNIKSLVERLNSTCHRALEAAAGLCLSRTNYNVEIEHWLFKLIEHPNSDLSLLFRHFEVNTSNLSRDLTAGLDRLKSGNARPPALSPNAVQLIREAWLIASIDNSASRCRSGHLLCALLTDDSLRRMAVDISPELEKISQEALRNDLMNIVADSDESSEEAASEKPVSGSGKVAGGPTNTPSLDQFTTNMTALAKSGKFDPVVGRESEVRQIVDILTRRRQNNPILTGEAGVGKTAVVEGFALRVATGDIPPALKNVSIRNLDLSLLQAGAGIKGEFENRLKSVIDEVKASPQPIILFIDEAHTMIGAGGSAGQGDAANILKPALARGELRTIAATTWAEYKKYFEKDAALARRFQVVKVDEPSEKRAIDMMRGLVGPLEDGHGVRVLDEAVVDAVRLSSRYISGRQLPDKSVSLLDTACARVAIGHASTPPKVEDCRRRIDQLKLATEILQREEASGSDHSERIAEMNDEHETAVSDLESLEQRWAQEKELVETIRDARAKLEGAAASVSEQGESKTDAKGDSTDAKESVPASPPLSPEEIEKLSTEQERFSHQLSELQGEDPLMRVCVDSQAVAEVVSGWTGIPVGRMVSDEIRSVLTLREQMEQAIIGQSHGLEAISQRIQTSRAKLSDPRTPIGVFLLAGSSGVGKTETAITLAELLYGGEQNMTVINMSEYKEEHKVSLLMGSPPGYVGYGEGGVLTEAVRRKPYSVILLDEMEKAHPGVQDIFYQVFDKGAMKDGEGRDIDFKNTLIIMTSNAGTDIITSLCADPETRPEPEALADALHEELLKFFKPAFLGRLNVIPYYPLSDDVMRQIVDLKLGKIVRRVADNYRATLSYTPELVTSIVERCTEVDTGARNVDHILTRSMLPELAAEFLSHMAEGRQISNVQVTVDADGSFAYEISG